MPAAAPVPLRKAVGRAQKTSTAERRPTAAIVIATISEQQRRLGLGGQPVPSTSKSAGTIRQGRRLGARPARRPTISIVAVAIPNGIAARTPTSKPL
jgi:hypothetical protein